MLSKYSLFNIILWLANVTCDFVHVMQDSKDIWWFEHNGKKFISMGVNHVNNGGWDDGVGGRESSICQERTNNSLCGDTLSFCGELGYSPYYNNTQSKYGHKTLTSISEQTSKSQSIESNKTKTMLTSTDTNATMIWANITMNRLKSWNLNTISGWSSSLMERVASENNVYYAHLLDMGTTWITHSDGLDFDVFSIEFEQHCLNISFNSVLPRQNDEYLLGWQLDNELLWHKIDLIKYLNYSINTNGYKKAIDYLESYYDDNIINLNNAWNINATNWNNLHFLISNQTYSIDYYYKNIQFNINNEEFSYIIAKKYFNITVSAIKKYDKNHLILGVRNLFIPKYVEKAMIPFVDTIDKHCYGNPKINISDPSCLVDSNPCNDLDSLYQSVQKPIYIGEFSFISSQSNNPNTKGARHNCPEATQTGRGIAYNEYVNKLMGKKYAIGFHWWQYADEPPLGRWPDGEDCNYGLVDINDNPWTDLTDMITSVNPSLYALHNQSTVIY